MAAKRVTVPSTRSTRRLDVGIPFGTPIPGARDVLHRWIEDSGVAVLLDLIDAAGCSSYVSAGAARDAIRYSQGLEATEPRDFDIAIEGLQGSLFSALMSEFGGTRNRYGGYRLNLANGGGCDVWRLESSCGLRAAKVAPSLSNMLRTFVFDLNSVAFDASTGLFYDNGCLRALRSKSLGLADEAIVHSEGWFAAKAVSLQLRFGLSLQRPIRQLIRTKLTRASLMHELNKAWPPDVVSDITKSLVIAEP